MFKNIASILILFFTAHFAFAQSFVLYGTTYGGGTNGKGTVFSYDPSLAKENVLIDFDSSNGSEPVGNLSYDTLAGGMLYGTANSGGKNNAGVLYSYSLESAKDSSLFEYSGAEGKRPGQGSLSYYNGVFYGMTNGGGTHGFGTLYMYNPASDKDSILVDFDTSSGKEYGPLGSNLILYPANSILYGATFSGGSNGMGAIFSFNPATGKDSVVFNMNTNSGNGPQEGTLILNPVNALLYGVTSAGGTYDNGVLFSFNPINGQLTPLIQFNVLNGSNPLGGLMLDTLNGLMYGLTNAGGLYGYGVLFSFDAALNKETVLYNFNDTLGSAPTANLILGPDGKLYGTTQQDETGNGLVFSYDISTSQYKVEHRFNFSDGSSPYGSLTCVTKPVISSLNEIGESQRFLVYPNPFSSYTTVLFKEEGEHFIQLTNVMGQKVLETKTSEQQYRIERNELAPGIYFLSIYNTQMHYLSTSKVIVE